MLQFSLVDASYQPAIISHMNFIYTDNPYCPQLSKKASRPEYSRLKVINTSYDSSFIRVKKRLQLQSPILNMMCFIWFYLPGSLSFFMHNIMLKRLETLGTRLLTKSWISNYCSTMPVAMIQCCQTLTAPFGDRTVVLQLTKDTKHFIILYTTKNIFQTIIFLI
jgi:hypothetical protein